MSATDYVPDLRDQRFVLFEQLRVQDYEAAEFADYDLETYSMVLEEAANQARSLIAPLNGPGDRAGCRFEDGAVTTPPGYPAAYKAFGQGGWIGIGMGTEHGGQGMPSPLALAVIESFVGAGCAFMMYAGLTTAGANLLAEMGEPWMREHVLPRLISGEWTGTMCLTEPQAGSAVGDARMTAVPNGDHYVLTGTKIFVSGGEHDLTDNIVHIMLGRTADAPAGIKGLSLFLISKYDIDTATGALGDRNDVVCAGIEHKMGINGSATCTLNLGEGGGAKGWIIGNEGEGILRMFKMMNEARIGVGVQGMAVASAAWHNALGYARERVQGTSFDQFKDAGAERVAIIEHPDVRRMLLQCRSTVHGMRALGLTLAHWVQMHEQTGEDSWKDLVDVLVPICKSWNTDRCYEVASMALQVYGGYGYIGEYRVEQHVRDSKIFSIYEGTNGIQALDLVGRKLSQKGGRSFMAVMNHLNGVVDRVEGLDGFAAEHKALAAGRDRLGACAMHFMTKGMSGEPEIPVLQACNFLNLMGDVVVSILLGEQAAVAQPPLQALAEAAGVDLADPEARREFLRASAEARFYADKLDNLRFFAHQILPRTRGLQASITSDDRTALDAVL